MRIDGHMRLLLRRTTQVAVVLSVLFALTLPASAVETHQWTPEIAQAVTTRVVDGDTIEVLYKGHEYVVRMIGVDTPETVHPRRPVEPFGEEASRFTKQALEGNDVWLEFDVDQLDRYGRILAYVWTKPPSSWSDSEIRESMHNAALLLKGYGQLMTIQPNVRYVDAFVRYQAEARELGEGMWGIDHAQDQQPACVDLNTASLEELQLIIHIGPKRAEMIVQGRPWISVEELIKIDGIGRSRLQDILEQGLACVDCSCESLASAQYPGTPGQDE